MRLGTRPHRSDISMLEQFMPVGYVYDPIYLEHDHEDHPESSTRLTAIIEYLREVGLLSRLTPIPAEKAALEDLVRVHDRRYIEFMRQLAEGGGGWPDSDTYANARSYEVALYAAGGVIAATRAVLNGEVDSAYALVRPPGHHATRNGAEGFCLFNNVAVATAWALASAKVSRVAIVDLDVHHGNGTQEAFWDDSRVLFASTHQYGDGFYPGTGHWREKGSDGNCLNIPLPPHTGDAGYMQAFQWLVEPAVRHFRPELIMVSAGYDGHWAERLFRTAMLLSLTGYRRLMDSLVGLARELCGGRLVLALEGGYDLRVLACGVADVFRALLGLPSEDPLGPAGEQEVSVEEYLKAIARWHELQ